MKKVLLTLALAAFAFAANAQYVIGGQIGVNHDGNANGDYSNNSNTTLTIMPKVGYWLNDNMQVGLNFGVDYNYNRNYAGDNNNDHYFSNTQLQYQIAPYFRYNFAQWNNFKVFCEAQLAFGITPKGSWKNTVANTSGNGNTKATAIDLTVVPGLNYALTENISLDLYVNLLGLYYNYTTTTTTVAGVDNVVKDHSMGLLADMTAQPFLGIGVAGLAGHLTNFAVGFNYSF